MCANPCACVSLYVCMFVCACVCVCVYVYVCTRGTVVVLVSRVRVTIYVCMFIEVLCIQLVDRMKHGMLILDDEIQRYSNDIIIIISIMMGS